MEPIRENLHWFLCNLAWLVKEASFRYRYSYPFLDYEILIRLESNLANRATVIRIL